MGTSTNQRSPSTPNWRAAQAAYSNAEIPVARAIEEIWRAATNQPEGDIAEGLASPIVATCLQIALAASSREEAITTAATQIALSGEASLAADIAKRAVALSFREGQDRAAAFAGSLFAEASNYLVSRDLPGYVGEQGRVRNVGESLAFKTDVRQQVLAAVAETPRPKPAAGLMGWNAYVAEVVDRLRGTPRRAR